MFTFVQDKITLPRALAGIKLCYFPEQPESMQIFAKPKHLMRQPLATRHTECGIYS